MKKALLFGASGFVGSFILRALLDNPEYERVTAVMRKKPEIDHPKLNVVLGDLQTLPSLKSEMECDDVFIAIGTTKKKTPNEKTYYVIDHDYPVLAASLAKEMGASSVFLVSAIGADAKSGLFYVRTKGVTEHDVIALGFVHTHIFRPSIIMGDRPESRPMEKIFILACAIINPLLMGPLR